MNHSSVNLQAAEKKEKAGHRVNAFIHPHNTSTCASFSHLLLDFRV